MPLAGFLTAGAFTTFLVSPLTFFSSQEEDDESVGDNVAFFLSFAEENEVDDQNLSLLFESPTSRKFINQSSRYTYQSLHSLIPPRLAAPTNHGIPTNHIPLSIDRKTKSFFIKSFFFHVSLKCTH